MKYVLFILFSTLITGVQAKSYLQNTYIVVSDRPSKDVPKGSCRIKGNVYNGGGVLQNALISNLDRSRSGVSNNEGKYSFMLSSMDTAIFFFKEGFSEQVIWSYAFKSGHEVHIDFYAGNDPMILEVDKPIIYLYSEQDISVSVKPDFKGDLTFTYPELNDAWNVEIVDNQIVDINSKKTYPYLFWEGKMNELDYDYVDDVLYGEELQAAEVITYLEKSLSEMGLNQKEKSDFITFWGPRLTAKPFAFIQFLVDDQVDDNLGALEVCPAPDVQKRIYMLFKTFDSPQNIQYVPQQFEKLNREGFTLIEWGGTELNQTALKL